MQLFQIKSKDTQVTPELIEGLLRKHFNENHLISDFEVKEIWWKNDIENNDLSKRIWV